MATKTTAKKTPAKKAAAKKKAPAKKAAAKKKAPAKKKAGKRGPRRERVLVTGAAGGLGRLVCRMLHRDYEVIAVDRRPFPDRPKDVNHLRVDVRRKSAQKEIRKQKPDVIVHLGVMHNPHKAGGAFHFNLEGTTQLLRLAEKIDVRKFVFLSTANLYGPSATSSGFMTEEAPLLAGGRSPEIRDLISLDMMVQSFFWKRPETETVILRPVHIIGPHLRNAPTTYLRKDNVPTLMGFDPMIQLIHESDVVRSIAAAVKKPARGVYNITGDSAAPLSRIVMARRKNQVPLPGPVFKSFVKRAFKVRLTNFPPSEIVHLKYSCLVDGSRAEKELGFHAKVSLTDALVDLGS